MELTKMLIELRRERERIEQVILSLEKLILNRDHKLRGRPPKWLTEARKIAQHTRPGRALH